MHSSDICIAGAGIIGLSVALELQSRGARVTVLEQAQPLAEASTAAAGMLAAADPENPSALRPLADLSLSLYPAFLEQLYHLSGIAVPFQTSTTLQAAPSHLADTAASLTLEEVHQVVPELTAGDHRFLLLDEQSLDPRQLAAALLAAVGTTEIDLRPGSRVLSVDSQHGSVRVEASTGTLHARQFVDCTGAWVANSFTPPPPGAAAPVFPRKGQLLSVALPEALQLRTVVRTSEIYIVPRTQGPQAGRAIVGATIEDAGFDKSVHPADIARLQAMAARLLPQLASARVVESWAGLRPATMDDLPLLGPMPGSPHCFRSAGHYRNGILLAPATARVMAQLLSGESPSVDLGAFSPARISLSGE